MMIPEICVRKVRVENYKSIGKCEVCLGSLTILVGRNGAGKSNFLDALRFTSDALTTSLDHAIKSRGGIGAVRRQSYGHPRSFRIDLEVGLPSGPVAKYGFEIGSRQKSGFYVKRESLRITTPSGREASCFTLCDGEVSSTNIPSPPPSLPDRLYLVNASGIPEIRPVYDLLTAMGFYSLNPEEMRKPQSPDAGDLLHRDGSNIASVVSRLTEDRPELKDRITEYLQAIVPDIDDFERAAFGNHETLQFRQDDKGSKNPWRFYAASMSDGTLRALGILVAVMQLVNRENAVRLAGIEEPEVALHPAACGALMDSLREAAKHTQIVITTHSPDLLDQFDSTADRLLVVQAQQGTTDIGPVDPSSLSAIRTHLYSAGELLRMDQLEPDPGQSAEQTELAFDRSGDQQ